MPRGGARVGAGRPKKQIPGTASLLGLDCGRIFGQPGASSATESDAATMALRVPPKGLPKAQRTYWCEYAQHAIARRTLVPEHVPGFRQLCRLAWVADEMAKNIEALGPTSVAGMDAMVQWMKVEQRLESVLQRFDLTGLGKPTADVVRGRKAGQPANPFGFIAGGQR